MGGRVLAAAATGALAASFPDSDFGSAGGDTPWRAVFEEQGHWKLAPGLLQNLHADGLGDERIAADVEEIVVGSDPIQAEHAGEDLGNQGFELAFRRHVRGGQSQTRALHRG